MSEYEDIMQYYYLVLCNRLIEKIPEVPQEILEQGFLAETESYSGTGLRYYMRFAG